MFVSVDSRESSGSARSRLPYGVSLSRNRTERMVQKWYEKKQNPQKHYLDAQEREDVYKLARICTTMMRDNRGVGGEVSRAGGGALVTPTIDPTHIQRYFGDVKGFGAVDELVSIVTRGVPVNAVMCGVDLERALQYRNHRSVSDHLPAIWEKIGEDARRQKCLVIQKSAAHEIPNLRVSPLAAVVTYKLSTTRSSTHRADSRRAG